MRQVRRHRVGLHDPPPDGPRRFLAVPRVEPRGQAGAPAAFLRHRVERQGRGVGTAGKLFGRGPRRRRRPPAGERRPGRLERTPRGRQPGVVLGAGNQPLRLVGVVHERHEGEVVGVRDRVELVRVALGTGGGEPEPGRARGAHAIDHREIPELERIDPALLVLHRVAMETGGDDVVGGGAREQVAGDLPDRELVERHVGVERTDHPVAIGPDLPLPVFLVAIGVGVAGEVEPLAGPALAIPRAREQPVDEPLVGVGGRVVQEGVELHGRRRQTGEVEEHAPAERRLVGLGRGCEPLALEPRPHESVDLVPRPFGVSDVGHGRPLVLHERPVRPVLGAGLDPFGENPFLISRERHLRVRRRHDEIGIGARDPGDDLAVERMAGHHCAGTAVEFGDRRLTHVEPQAGLAVSLVGSVALEAAIGEDRPDLVGEVRPGGDRHGRRELAQDRDKRTPRPALHGSHLWTNANTPRLLATITSSLPSPSRSPTVTCVPTPLSASISWAT